MENDYIIVAKWWDGAAGYQYILQRRRRGLARLVLGEWEDKARTIVESNALAWKEHYGIKEEVIYRD